MRDTQIPQPRVVLPHEHLEFLDELRSGQRGRGGEEVLRSGSDRLDCVEERADGLRGRGEPGGDAGDEGLGVPADAGVGDEEADGGEACWTSG